MFVETNSINAWGSIGANFYHKSDKSSRGICKDSVFLDGVQFYFIEWSKGELQDDWFTRSEIGVVFPGNL